jgi:hypothetical protein
MRYAAPSFAPIPPRRCSELFFFASRVEGGDAAAAPGGGPSRSPVQMTQLCARRAIAMRAGRAPKHRARIHRYAPSGVARRWHQRLTRSIAAQERRGAVTARQLAYERVLARTLAPSPPLPRERASAVAATHLKQNDLVYQKARDGHVLLVTLRSAQGGANVHPYAHLTRALRAASSLVRSRADS